jgi:hypothetical protein
MRCYELSKEPSDLIEDLLSFHGMVGGQWKDHHSLLNGMFWSSTAALSDAKCPNAMDLGRPDTIASTAGEKTELWKNAVPSSPETR